jgi:hypothetical protein
MGCCYVRTGVREQTEARIYFPFALIIHLIIDHFDSGVHGTGSIREASPMQCAVQVQQAAKTARALKHPTEGAAR